MSRSGVAVNPECLEKFNELKLGKKHKFIIFSLNEKYTEIVVNSVSEETDYDAFLKALPENQSRYAVYDLEYTKEDEGKRNKIFFFSWIPEGAKIREKMVYSSSKDYLKRSLTGVTHEIQGTDYDEISYESLLGRRL